MFSCLIYKIYHKKLDYIWLHLCTFNEYCVLRISKNVSCSKRYTSKEKYHNNRLWTIFFTRIWQIKSDKINLCYLKELSAPSVVLSPYFNASIDTFCNEKVCQKYPNQSFCERLGIWGSVTFLDSKIKAPTN